MSEVILGLYTEGSTDYDFLPSVIRRTTEQVLVQHDRNEMELSSYLQFVDDLTATLRTLNLIK
jgi:hypothetical protein